MKKTYIMIVATCLLFTAATVDNSQTLVGDSRTFSGGSGTIADPYMISTPEQLNQVRNNLAAHFKLANDIDLTEYLTTTGGGYLQWHEEGWLPIGVRSVPFRGSFDGAGFKIKGLWINRVNDCWIGLFGVTLNTTIKNLGIEIGDRGVRGFCDVAGLIGRQEITSVINCYVIGDVYGRNDAGGVIGEIVRNSVVKNSYFIGNVYGGYYCAGGLAGHIMNSCTVENSYSIGNVVGNIQVGGFVGQNAGKVSDCYNTGSVIGNEQVGGFVGDGQRGTFLGNSFFDTQTTGQTIGVGSGSQERMTGKTTAEMKQRNTFTGWDFASVWDIVSNEYPKLR